MRTALGRLYLILGSLIVLLLLAVLVGPYFIDWNGFRSTFEDQVSAMLGQPVRIAGNIEFIVVPGPRLVFDDVAVGEAEGTPMMTVGRVTARIELMPFLSGQIVLTELALDRPRIRVNVDDAGTVDWGIRPDGRGTLDPERVALDAVVITNGEVTFFDARTGAAVELTSINTNLFEAATLLGPWRIEGSLVCRASQFCGDGLPMSFSVSTGRYGDSGTMRVNAEITPSTESVAGTLRTDGMVSRGEAGLAYEGTFRFDRLVTAASGASAVPGEDQLAWGWSVAGAFNLNAERLAVTEATVEPGWGSTTFTGGGTLVLGDATRFDAALTARQIDLNTLVGAGPANAIGVAEAAAALAEGIRAIQPPDIPGRVTLDVPAIIVSGSALQNFTLDLEAAADHWAIAELAIDLPGRSHFSVTGNLTTGDLLAFSGSINLSSEQPAALANWWRGPGDAPEGLMPFTALFSGDIGPGRVDAARVELAIGSTQVAGTVNWRSAGTTEGSRLAAQIEAERLDVDQMAAFGRLFFGPGLSDPGALADTYELRFEAGDIQVGEVAMAGVIVDLNGTPGTVTINEFTIADLGGGRLTATGGTLDLQSSPPRGLLSATLEAEALDGVIALSRRFGLDPSVIGWLARAAPYLVPANITVTIQGPSPAGADFSIELAGIAGGTTLRAEAGFTGALRDLVGDPVALTVEIDAPDAARLMRQAGLDAGAIADVGRAVIDFSANGVPADGMATQLQATIAGVSIFSDGVATVRPSPAVTFDGAVSVRGDLRPVMLLAGLDLPGMADEVPAALEASLRIAGDAVEIALAPSSIAAKAVTGTLRLTAENGRSRLGGTLDLEELDLGWLTTLPLGVEPMPTADPDEPWSRTPFTGSVLQELSADIDITAARLMVGDGLMLTNASIGLSLGPAGAAIDLASAGLGGGTVRGSLNAAIQQGQALIDGQIIMAAVPVTTLVWRSDGQPVAEGTLDLSLRFQASGRSPAGLIATLIGDGTLQMRDGVFHFMSADAFDLIIRRADEGQPFDEARLREAFTGFLDAGDLPFPVANATFDIAGGVVTPRTIFVDGGGATTVARAQIDLNRLFVDSSWEFALRQAADGGQGSPPSVFITFTGSLAQPERRINVAPLAGYLSLRSLRQAERLQAEVLERERFIRLIERIEADRLQRLEEERLRRLQEEAVPVAPPVQPELPPPLLLLPNL